MRALLFLELGNEEDAIAALRRVHYLNPDFVLAYVILGNLFHKRRKKSEAIKYYDHALLLLNSINPDEILGDITAGRLCEIVRSIREME